MQVKKCGYMQICLSMIDGERLSFRHVQLKVNEEGAACSVAGGVAGGPASCDSGHMQPAALYAHHTQTHSVLSPAEHITDTS